jgi:threonine synthase
MNKKTILVATSGDTGGAIGDAFLNQKNINVIILFPKNGVSKVQEQQLCTIGDSYSNIQAVKVNGTFDDCQKLVKDAFSNKSMSKKFSLMSANSINVGRVIPQSFYYLWSSLQVKATNPSLPIVYSIPSGNLGNLTGGLLAKKMGAPIERFIVGNNANDPFVRYLKSGNYNPLPSIPTLSNAMDIGRPNNFPRILELCSNNYENITDVCKGFSFSDTDTEIHIKKIFNETGYLMCPHTAIGHLAMIEYRNKNRADFIGVTVATAHPSKFTENVDRIIGHETEMPDALKSIFQKKKIYNTISPNITELEAILLNSIL